MPFGLQTYITVGYTGECDHDELLRVTTRDGGVFYLRATFRDEPLPSPYAVELDLLRHDGLRSFFEHQLDDLAYGASEVVRLMGRSLYCTHLGDSRKPYRFVVRDGEDHHGWYLIQPEEVVGITAIRREELASTSI